MNVPHSTNTVMQNAVTAAANGTAVVVDNMASLVMYCAITNATVTFESTVDLTNWVAVQCENLNDGAPVTSTTASGLFRCAVAGLRLVRARVSGITGTVTVTGFATTASAGMTLADIDIVGQEDVNVAQMNGVATTMGAGNVGTGVQRVAVATDDVNLAAINAVSGTTSGAAVITDAAGTIQQYLRGLVKLIAAKIGITVADGDNAALGITSGAAVVTDANGTVQQYLRGLVKLIVDIMTVKIDQTTPGTTNRVDIGVITAGETHVGEVGYSAITITQQPTITAGAYVAADAVGGLLTFANAARVSGGTGRIDSVVIVDDAKQNVALDLVLFDQTFTNTADNAAFDPSDADLENCIGVIPIETTDYASFNNNSVATVSDKPLGFTLDATSMFGQLKTRGAPTYAATSDLTVKIHITRD